MITYISVGFPGSNARNYANKYPVNAADPQLPPTMQWSRALISIDSKIEQWGNFGDSWRVSNFTFTLPDNDGAWNNITDTAIYPHTRNGASVFVSFMDEVFNETFGYWEMVERGAWSGVIDTIQKKGIGKIQVNCTQLNGSLGNTVPSDTIRAEEFPSAFDEAFGQPIQSLSGSFQLSGGAVKAWNVGDGRYLLSKNTLTGGVSSVFVGDILIPAEYWWMVFDAQGKTYIKYPPPVGVEGIPEQETACLYCNVEATDSSNPLDCLEETLAAADYSFSGDVAVRSEMEARGYIAAMCLSMGDKLGDLVTHFCSNFDCFATFEGGLKVGFVNPTPVKTITDSMIKSASERQDSSLIANYARIAWAFDFPRNNFACEDVFIQSTSLGKYGRHELIMEYFLTRDPDTAFDVTRRRIRQLQDMPRILDIELPFANQADIKIGDVITVNSSKWLVFVNAHDYLVKGKTIDPLSEMVTLHCQSYSNISDHIIRVFKNFDGGSVSPSGNIVVTHGALNQAITATPYAHHILQSILVDGVTPAAGPSYTFYNIVADHTILFTFQTTAHRIEASDDGYVIINPKGDVFVAAGGSQTFTVTPKPGRYFSHWLVDGQRVTAYPLTLTNVTAPHTVVAFSTTKIPESIKVTTTRSGVGTVTPVPGGVAALHIGQYQYGADIWRHYDRPANVTVNGVLSTGVMWTHIKPLTQDTLIEVVFP